MDHLRMIVALQDRIFSLEDDIRNLRAERDLAIQLASRDHAGLMLRQSWLKEFHRRIRDQKSPLARDIQYALSGLPVKNSYEPRNARRRKPK